MRPAADERAHAQRVLTFALDVAMQMFRQGLETDGIVRTVRALAAAGIITSLVNWVGLTVLGLAAPLSILLATTVLGVFAGPAMYASLSHVFAHVPGAWSSVVEAVLATAAIGIGVVLGQQLVALRHSAGSGTSLN